MRLRKKVANTIVIVVGLIALAGALFLLFSALYGFIRMLIFQPETRIPTLIGIVILMGIGTVFWAFEEAQF